MLASSQLVQNRRKGEVARSEKLVEGRREPSGGKVAAPARTEQNKTADTPMAVTARIWLRGQSNRARNVPIRRCATLEYTGNLGNMLKSMADTITIVEAVRLR
jgi:hypothetical protein